MTCATLAVVFLALGAQRPAIGSQAPPVSARDLQGVERTLQSLGGPRGLVVFFWATWSERSLEELKRIEGAQEEIRSHGVGIVALNVDHETLSAADLETVRTKVSAVGVTMPVLIDEGLKAFHAYGVVTVPSTALIDGEGKLAGFFPGYAHEQREALFDALDELAGIARTRPAVETPRGSPAAVRRLQLGRAQLAQGRTAAARASFEAAATDQTFADPIVELAALALDEGDLPRARAELDRAAAIDASSRALRRERARLDLAGNKPEEAKAALQELARDPKDGLAQAYLGFSLLLAGAREAAAACFDSVAPMAGLDPRRFIDPPDSVAPADIARALASFRHAVAVKAW